MQAKAKQGPGSHNRNRDTWVLVDRTKEPGSQHIEGQGTNPDRKGMAGAREKGKTREPKAKGQNRGRKGQKAGSKRCQNSRPPQRNGIQNGPTRRAEPKARRPGKEAKNAPKAIKRGKGPQGRNRGGPQGKGVLLPNTVVYPGPGNQ